MPITWVPSKKALSKLSTLGVVLPADWEEKYNLPASKAFGPGDVPFDSLVVMATQAYRHGMNNVVASAVLAAQGNAKEKGDDTFDPSTFAHTKRMEYIDAIMSGQLGIRTSTSSDADVGLSERDRIAYDKAFEMTRANVIAKGFTGIKPDRRRDVKSLAIVVSDDGKTIGDLVNILLFKAKARHDIWAFADEEMVRRTAERAKAAAADSDDLFAIDEDEPAAA